MFANKDLYILTSRLQNYIATGASDPRQVNYRILHARVSDLTRKTACDVARFDNSGYNASNSGNNVNIHPSTSSFSSSGFYSAQSSQVTSFIVPKAPSAPVANVAWNGNPPNKNIVSGNKNNYSYGNGNNAPGNGSPSKESIVFPN